MGQMARGSQLQELRSMHTSGRLQGSETAAVASGPDGWIRAAPAERPAVRVKICPTAVSVRGRGEALLRTSDDAPPRHK